MLYATYTLLDRITAIRKGIFVIRRCLFIIILKICFAASLVFLEGEVAHGWCVFFQNVGIWVRCYLRRRLVFIALAVA